MGGRTSPLLLLATGALLLAAAPGALATFKCDPFTYQYKTAQYYSTDDCRTYTLYDVNLACGLDSHYAAKACESRGLELAPWDHRNSKGERVEDNTAHLAAARS